MPDIARLVLISLLMLSISQNLVSLIEIVHAEKYVKNHMQDDALKELKISHNYVFIMKNAGVIIVLILPHLVVGRIFAKSDHMLNP